MDYRANSLVNVSFGEIHRCFAASFADYAVRAAVMDEAALARRARKNDWVAGLSSGVWSGDELVAVSLTGLDRIDGELRGYDICTGVVPQHRGRGLAGRMMADMVPRLAEAGAKAMQLEVLKDNAGAIRAYTRAGFASVRGLLSYVAEAQSLRSHQPGLEVGPIDPEDLAALVTQQEFPPSYEQRDAALAHLSDDLVRLGARLDGRCIAALAYDPPSGWIMRWVTHRAFRRRGAAAALVAALAQRVQGTAPIKAINIDENDQASRALAEHCGLTQSLGQWEMRLDL